MNVIVADLENLRHMLGAESERPRKSWGFRNYFSASPMSSDHGSMERLVAMGLAVKGQETSDLVFYHATLDGCSAVGMTQRDIDRSDAACRMRPRK